MVQKKSKDDKKPNYLVCVNAEEYSEAALYFTCHLAKKNNGSIILLHVIEPSDYQSIGMVADKIRQEKLAESQKLLNTLAGKAKERGDIMPIVMVREGYIEEEIITYVKEDPSVKMLIVGVSSKNSKNSKTTQSLAASIGNKLKIPMLIIPGNYSSHRLKDVS